MRFFDEFNNSRATDRLLSSRVEAYHEMRRLLRDAWHADRDAQQDGRAAVWLAALGLAALVVGAGVVAVGLGIGAGVFGVTAATHKSQGARQRRNYDALKKTVVNETYRPYIRQVNQPSLG